MKKQLEDFYQNYKLYIFPAIAALCSLFLIAYAVYPQGVKLITNRQVAADLARKTKLLEEKVASLESYNIEDLSIKVSNAVKAYPAEKDYINILGLLQDLVKRSGFNVNSITFEGDGVKSADSSSYIVKLQTKGTKALFQTLLNNLERSAPVLRIKNFDISSSQTSQVLEASIVIEVLYSALPKNTGSEDAPVPQITQAEEELLVRLAEASETGLTAGTQSAAISLSGYLNTSSPSGKLNPFD